jgi:peptidase E
MQLFLTSVSGGVESIDYLKENINSQTKLVVLPFANHFDYLSNEEDIYNHFDRNVLNKESIFWQTVRSFIDIGINPDRIVIINRFSDPINLIKHKLLADNTIVYLPGGFPENIVKILKELKLVDTIKQCKIVVGESAGSMFWSRKYFVYPDNDYPKYRCFRGIRMIKDFVIIPHYNKEDKKMRRSIVSSTRKFKKLHREKVYLVEDGGWVWYDSDAKKIIDCKKCSIIG